MKTKRVVLDFGAIKDEGQLRQHVFREVLRTEVDVSNKRLVDLGAGPCNFARTANRFGAEVTAVDARDERVLKDLEKDRISFVRGDIREVDVSPFDIVLIFGLLYHLDIDDQIDLLRRCKDKVVLIDIQVCCPDLVVRYPQENWQYPPIRLKNYEGIIYPEEDNPMASVGNKTSFWHTERSYLKLFSDCGFENVVVYRPLYLAKYGMRSFYLLKR